jgi:hypothetical protein
MPISLIFLNFCPPPMLAFLPSYPLFPAQCSIDPNNCHMFSVKLSFINTTQTFLRLLFNFVLKVRVGLRPALAPRPSMIYWALINANNNSVEERTVKIWSISSPSAMSFGKRQQYTVMTTA